MTFDTETFSIDCVVLDAAWTVAQAQLVLQHTECAFVVVRRREDELYVYLFPRHTVRWQLDRAQDDALVLDALDLHEFSATPTIRPDQVADTTGLAVVLDKDGAISGVVLPPGLSKSISKDVSAFEAYPAIIAPLAATMQQTIDVAVGFRSQPDPAVIGGATPLVVADVQAGEECMIVVTGDGLTFDRSTDWLPWRMNELRMFSATPTRTGQCTIRVDYYRQRQLVGHAERRVAVDTNDLPAGATGAALDFRPNDMDLLITLRRDGDLLRWTAMPQDPALDPVIDEPGLAPLTTLAAQQLAVALIHDAVQPNPIFAANGIQGVASSLTRWVPAKIWQLQADLAARRQRMLTVLLKTDEVFVPWELAEVPAPVAIGRPGEPEPPLFWGTQTYFGRWIDDVQALPLPPPATTITRLTAVTSGYGKDTGQSALPHAALEGELLRDTWQATPCEATSDALAPLFTQPATAGHLIHFAVHGYSEPLARTHELILADQQTLSPRTLMGRRGQNPPRFSLVFLNACQVATPGTSLGQTAGFPGEVIAGGAVGFIAPLWEADDREAFNFARMFYERAFAAQPIGAIVQAYRASYSPNVTSTRLAYVYYGHPALRLTYQPA